MGYQHLRTQDPSGNFGYTMLDKIVGWAPIPDDYKSQFNIPPGFKGPATALVVVSGGSPAIVVATPKEIQDRLAYANRAPAILEFEILHPEAFEEDEEGPLDE